MKLKICVLLLLPGLCAGALADEPKAPPAQPATSETPAPNAPSGDAPKPGTAAATATPAKTDTSEIVNIADTEALIKKMRGRGYKPINRNGILVFCRSEGEIGTHFERVRCNTADELKRAELTGREYALHIQQQASPTPFAPAGGEH